jgi:hypothetical protein
MKQLIKLVTLFIVTLSAVNADLKTDLTALNHSMVELNGNITDTNLTSDSMCAPLIALSQQSKEIVDTLTVTDENITAPLTLDNETLVLTEELFINVAALSNASSLLSTEIALLQPTTNAITLKDGITAMLQLSSDIGEMADRIGEMADKILIMSDNIGLMADRILETQVIQNENIALTQNTLLTTQTNILMLVSVVESASYDLTLESLITDGNILATQMSLVFLDPWNMARELQDVKEDVNTYLVQVQAFQTIINSDSLESTMTVNAQSLNALVDLSLIMTSLGTAIDGYILAIEASKNMTREATLLDAMNSMLILSADIGRMSNSILEMADQILLMSDNIGMEADQIVLTQQMQNTNVAAAQTSILAAQQLALGIIAASN